MLLHDGDNVLQRLLSGFPCTGLAVAADRASLPLASLSDIPPLSHNICFDRTSWWLLLFVFNTQKRLLIETGLTFAKAIEIAQGMEIARDSLKRMQSPTTAGKLVVTNVQYVIRSHAIDVVSLTMKPGHSIKVIGEAEVNVTMVNRLLCHWWWWKELAWVC